MSKANAFSALFKEAARHGVAETDKPDEAAHPRPARPRGKRDDPAFGKIGVYVRSSTITEVKARLIRQDCDLSDLVQALLDDWLKRDGKTP
jgi:hypothetical protein